MRALVPQPIGLGHGAARLRVGSRGLYSQDTRSARVRPRSRRHGGNRTRRILPRGGYRWALAAERGASDGRRIAADYWSAQGLLRAARHTAMAHHEQEPGIMSAGNITSNTWTPPLPPQPIPGTAGDPFSPASSTVASTPGSASPTAGPTNPFQHLASDIQAMLLQVQGGTAAQPAASVGSVTTAPTAIGGTIASNPEQQVVSDVQAMLAQLQNGQTSSGTTMQTA